MSEQQEHGKRARSVSASTENAEGAAAARRRKCSSASSCSDGSNKDTQPPFAPSHASSGRERMAPQPLAVAVMVAVRRQLCFRAVRHMLLLL